MEIRIRILTVQSFVSIWGVKLMKHSQIWLQGTPVVALVLMVGAFVFESTPPPVAKRKAVVVELFTSEGCSSCPPADALLVRMERALSANGAEIIPLGFHVDYWDHLGWRDRFSSHDFTARQEQYAARFGEGPYTPQLVVDGQSQLVGSDASGAERAIAQAAAQQQQAEVQLSWKTPEKLQVVATAEGVPSNQVLLLLLAITEDNLSSHVAAGENDGHTLNHTAVVRNLRLLGRLEKGRWEGEIPLKLSKDWKTKDLRVVAFVQSAAVGPIQGVASIGLPN